MDSIGINSNHSMEKDSKVSFFSFFFFFFFFFFFLWKVFLARRLGGGSRPCTYFTAPSSVVLTCEWFCCERKLAWR
jgi:hypothetical protein